MVDKHVGFVGVGRMGGRMATRLLDAGYTLTVCDTSDAAIAPLVARGARRAASAIEVASMAETVLASLPTPPIVEKTVLGEGGIAQGTKVKIFIDLSTTGPRVAARVAEGLAAKKIVAVDAPVSGGLAGA